MIPNEVLLQAAQDFVEQFRRSVQAFEQSNRDERFKPCMSQQKYADAIYSMLERKHQRPIYHDKNNVYQVLFAVGCLMGIKDHRRSWWEETFAIRTQDYLEHTTLFQGAKQLIQTTIRKVESILQYEMDFGSANPVQTAVQQTLNLFAEAEDMKQCLLPKVKPKRAKPKPKQQPSAQLTLNFYGSVGNIITDVNNLKLNNNE